MARLRITIDHAVCGDGHRVDPRACGRCLRACAPAIFSMHQTFGMTPRDPRDPEFWRITPLWPTLCDRCMACVEACPEKAITITGTNG